MDVRVGVESKVGVEFGLGVKTDLETVIPSESQESVVFFAIFDIFKRGARSFDRDSPAERIPHLWSWILRPVFPISRNKEDPFVPSVRG